jgi:hypothetical protein
MNSVTNCNKQVFQHVLTKFLPISQTDKFAVYVVTNISAKPVYIAVNPVSNAISFDILFMEACTIFTEPVHPRKLHMSMVML